MIYKDEQNKESANIAENLLEHYLLNETATFDTESNIRWTTFGSSASLNVRKEENAENKD